MKKHVLLALIGMKTKMILLTLCMIMVQSVLAQYRIEGHVKDQNNAALISASVVLLKNDSLYSGAITDKNGLFTFENISKGIYRVVVTYLGYETTEDSSLTISHNETLPDIIMKENSKQLDNVTVSADRRDIVKSNARSTTFLLSEKALKESKDAFEALVEVPKLIVDPSSKKIMLSDGSTPMILINGVKRSGYINSLDPADIEEVEIIENPSSKYRGEESVTSILNLKIKRKKNMYVNGNLSSKHDVGGHYGYSDGSIETGDSRKSFYLNALHFYFKETDKTNSVERNGEILRTLTGKYKTNTPMLTGGNLGGDWVATDRDYFSFSSNLYATIGHYDQQESGSIRTGNITRSLVSRTKTDTHDFNNENTLYYKHQFTKTEELELKGKVSYIEANSKGNRDERHGDDDAYTDLIDMNNHKMSYAFEANYGGRIRDLLDVNVGNNMYHQRVSTDDVEDSFDKYIYKDWRDYVFFDVSNVGSSKFSYLFSLGMDMVFTNADGVHNSYINFVPTLALSYKFNSHHILKLNGSRNRVSPSVGQLNPRNSSTDSLYIRTGNPYLKPTIDNQIGLSYEISLKKFFINPYITYHYYTDQVESCGEMTGNIYHSSYENIGSFHFLTSGISSRITIGNLGSINLGVYYNKSFYKDSPYSGNSVGIQGNLFLRYRKVTFGVYANNSRGMQYSQISKSQYMTQSELNVTWNLTKNFALRTGLRYFVPGFKYKYWSEDGEYASHSTAKYQNFMPLIGFSYNFRNNVKSVNRSKKRFWRSEEGVITNIK